MEGEPEETACENVIAAVKEAGYTKVILRPLMVVAGDHANNDMAGDDEDSWKSQFVASGNFESVDCQIAGLGEIDAIQQIYVAHTKAAIESLGSATLSSASRSEALADGTYSAKFDTDSSMFHVNEAYDGRGTLTVKKRKNDTPHRNAIPEHCKSFLRNCRRCTEGWSKTDPANNRRSYIL